MNSGGQWINPAGPTHIVPVSNYLLVERAVQVQPPRLLLAVRNVLPFLFE
jgi:hypothetical protein